MVRVVVMMVMMGMMVNGGVEYDDMYLSRGDEGGAAMYRVPAALRDAGRVHGARTFFLDVALHLQWGITSRTCASLTDGVGVI
ncbi:hypothetical protein Tco_0211565 [Tanacetum coccineum]